MSNITITNLPSVLAATATDKIPAVQNGTTVYLTAQQLATFTQGTYTYGPAIPAGYLIGNPDVTTAVPVATSYSGLMDIALGSTQGQIMYRGSGNWQALSPGIVGQILRTGGSGADPFWDTVSGTGSVYSIGIGTNLQSSTTNPIVTAGTISVVSDPSFNSLSLTTPLAVGSGGTGAASFTQYGILYGNSTGALQTITPPTGTNYVLVGSSTGTFTWQENIPVTAGVNSISLGTTGLTPTAATEGDVTVAFGSVPTAAGIYSPASNQIALSTNSTQQLLIDSAGASTFTTSVTSPLLIGTASRTSTATTGAFSYGTNSFSDTNVLASFQSSVNSYNQITVQNTSSGTASSAEFIAYNNNGTASTNYAAFGINSSGYTGTGSLNAAGYGFFVTGSTDLVLGTIGANAIHFVTNSASTDAMSISSAGVTTIANASITSLTTPIIYGGTTASSTLTLQSTSGAGTTDAIIFKVGNAGATTALTIGTGTAASLTFGGTAQRFIADFDNATISNRFAFTTTTTNSATGIYALPNGTSTASSWQATNNSDPTNASKILIATNGATDVQLVSGRNGSGTYLPLSFYTNNSQQMQLSVAGNFGIGNTPSGTYKLEVTGAALFSTSLTSPIHYGGTTASSTLTLQSTTGVGTTDAIVFKVGNNGAVTALNMSTTGNVQSPQGFYENIAAITANYTITANYNAVTAGPVNISATVTVPTGSSWTIV